MEKYPIYQEPWGATACDVHTFPDFFQCQHPMELIHVRERACCTQHPVTDHPGIETLDCTQFQVQGTANEAQRAGCVASYRVGLWLLLVLIVAAREEKLV